MGMPVLHWLLMQQERGLSGDLVTPVQICAAPEVCPTGSSRQGSLARIMGVLRPAV